MIPTMAILQRGKCNMSKKPENPTLGNGFTTRTLAPAAAEICKNGAVVNVL